MSDKDVHLNDYRVFYPTGDGAQADHFRLQAHNLQHEVERLQADLRGGRAKAIEQRDEAMARLALAEAKVERLRGMILVARAETPPNEYYSGCLMPSLRRKHEHLHRRRDYWHDQWEESQREVERLRSDLHEATTWREELGLEVERLFLEGQ